MSWNKRKDFSPLSQQDIETFDEPDFKQIEGTISYSSKVCIDDPDEVDSYFSELQSLDELDEVPDYIGELEDKISELNNVLLNIKRETTEQLNTIDGSGDEYLEFESYVDSVIDHCDQVIKDRYSETNIRACNTDLHSNLVRFLNSFNIYGQFTFNPFSERYVKEDVSVQINLIEKDYIIFTNKKEYLSVKLLSGNSIEARLDFNIEGIFKYFNIDVNQKELTIDPETIDYHNILHGDSVVLNYLKGRLLHDKD